MLGWIAPTEADDKSYSGMRSSRARGENREFVDELRRANHSGVLDDFGASPILAGARSASSGDTTARAFARPNDAGRFGDDRPEVDTSLHHRRQSRSSRGRPFFVYGASFATLLELPETPDHSVPMVARLPMRYVPVFTNG